MVKMFENLLQNIDVKARPEFNALTILLKEIKMLKVVTGNSIK